MDVLRFGGTVLLAGSRTQNALQTNVERLASGLRINTSADDPSGLAIAETLVAKVAGLDQGVRQIQDASNALTVADGALAAISGIVQRMRTLVVSARSDLLSTSDKADVQTELDQLTREINQIAQNTNFNGRALLDGSASSQTPLPARTLLAQNDHLSAGGTVLDTSIDPTQPAVSPNAPQLVQLLTIDSYDPVAMTLSFTATIGSQDSKFGPTQTAQQTVAAGTDYSLGGSPPVPGTPTYTQTDGAGNPVLSFNIGTLTAGDVGKSAVLVTLPAQSKAAGNALEVNNGNGEGTTNSVDIPAVSAVNLGVNQVAIGDDLQNQGAEYRIDYAIETLGGYRAQVGAQVVSLQNAASANNTASVNTQASESAIRDLNVGAEMTALTRNQIATQIQTAVLSNLKPLASSVTQLVASAALR